MHYCILFKFDNVWKDVLKAKILHSAFVNHMRESGGKAKIRLHPVGQR